MPSAAKKSADSEFKVIGTSPIRPDGVDKVTGRAKFGADLHLPGMLVGKILRSPHPHARLISIDTSRAEKLTGVKAIVTGKDFPEMPAPVGPQGPIYTDFRDITRSMMAREKVLFDGHPVAGVAATSEAVAKQALKLIRVKYKPLPHVIDPVEAMQPDAPVLHEKMITEGVEPTPKKPSNVAIRHQVSIGDIGAGFKAADVIVEREFNTKTVHQGYIEPQACVASVSEDGQADLWCSTQGHFVARGTCAQLLGWDISRIRVEAAEIGGGFGGKNNVIIEPVALALSARAARPVKMVMSREEVFRASGPTAGVNLRVKMGVTKAGRITAAEAELKYQAGAFRGAPVRGAMNCMLSPYDLENVKLVGWDVVVNRPKVAAYRAPGVPMAVFGVEGVVNELADAIGMDRVDLRLKNAAKEGTRTVAGMKIGPIGYEEVLRQVKAHPNYRKRLRANQGRGVASGYWGNAGGESCASVNVNADGTVTLLEGSPDLAGTRTSLAMMVAEELGIGLERVIPKVADTASLGFTFLAAGSRTTFATGMATVNATREAIRVLCERAAKVWDVSAEEVVWEDGEAKPASSNVGDFDPLSLAQLAKMAGRTGGAIAGHAEINAQGQGPTLGTHLVDVEVDPETGGVKVLRYTVVQDAGRAIHPAHVEGQFQGGAVQGIGWALNEEYVYGEDGILQNAGFLDYRIPVASDLPMIDTVIVEEPNPNHPYGVRGAGETPIVPPMAAVINAVENATGLRLNQLPMSPPRLLAAIQAAADGGKG